MCEFWSLLLVLILNMWTFTTADVDISCVLAEICILPCSFQPGTDPVIHWIQLEAGDIYVHSYYSTRDQFAHQSERFRGRTSLFKEQISRGNASLRMTGLQLQDKGRYKCYASTITGSNKESFINLRADAPVRNVDMEQVENSFTCRSEGIYPEPELTWSTSPPSNVTLQREPTVKKTEQQLYEISSTLTLSDTDTDLICTVSTRSGRRRVMWHRPTPVHVSHSETTTTIHCTAPNIKPPTHLVWKFNHSQIIVNQTEVHGPHEVSEQWRQQVEDVSASGSLTLHHLSSHHQGTFTCELSDEEETHLINSHVTIETETVSDSRIVSRVLPAVLLILAVVVVVVAGFYFKRRKIKCNKLKMKQTQSQTESSRLKSHNEEDDEDTRQEKKEMKPELEKDEQISQDEEDEGAEHVEDEDVNLEGRADSR